MSRPRFSIVPLALAAIVGLTTGLPSAAASSAGPPSATSVTAEPAADATTFTSPALRTRTDLNQGWRFVLEDATGAHEPGFDDASWQTVDTPHTWNAEDGADGGSDYHRGVGWYRRHVEVPASEAGRRQILQFAGVNQVAEVWVNGTHVGTHVGGYARFRFDVTEHLVVGGDNVVAVRVDNAHDPDIAPLNADFSFQGGIYRNVSLWSVDPLMVRVLDHAGPGVYVRQRDVSAEEATVEVTTKLWNNRGGSAQVAVRTTVTDADGAVVAQETSSAQALAAGRGTEVAQTLTIDSPRLWNGTADPYLHRVHAEVLDARTGTVTDVVTEPLGLRTIRIDPAGGFFLNGEHVPLKGVNIHQDRAGKGWAVNNADHVEDMRLVQEVGANAVRTAHYQHDQRTYDLADEMGMVVYAEIPFVNAYTDSAAFRENVEQQLVEMVRQNYNHPSIALWGIGNEIRTDDAVANEIVAMLQETVDAEDPDRITTYATCCIGDTGPLNRHADTASYNRYYGWYSRDMAHLGTWADQLHAKEPQRAIGISEYGAGANVEHHALHPDKPVTTGQWHPEEYQAEYHEQSWAEIEARPFIWGSFVWNMFDFASDRRDEGAQPGINDKGLVTWDRKIRKDAFWFYRAAWSDEPTLQVASERWTDRTDLLTDVKVYSNATSVRATLNGTSLGPRSSEDHVFRWEDVELRPGANTVEVTATIDGEVHTDTVTWHLGTRVDTDRIEAESHDREKGTNIVDTSDEGGGLHVEYIEAGDLLTYKRVDFGKHAPTQVSVRMSSGRDVPGGAVEVRLDGPTGPVVATVPVTRTGGWDDFVTVDAPMTTAVTGVRDVHLTFVGGGTGGVADLNWFTFDR